DGNIRNLRPHDVAGSRHEDDLIVFLHRPGRDDFITSAVRQDIAYTHCPAAVATELIEFRPFPVTPCSYGEEQVPGPDNRHDLEEVSGPQFNPPHTHGTASHGADRLFMEPEALALPGRENELHG